MDKKEDSKKRVEKRAEEKKGKDFFTSVWGKILIIFSSLILVFLIIWLGYSLFSLTRGESNLQVGIDLEGIELVEKVGVEEMRFQNKIYEYDFLFVLENSSENEDNYVLKGIPFRFEYDYDSRDEARFTTELPKDKGQFDFSELGWEPLLSLTIKYRVNQDMEYFLEYSICTLNEFLGKGDGECLIKRDIYEWEMEITDPAIESGYTLLPIY